MKLQPIIDKAKGLVGKVTFSCKKYSPEIFLVSGLVSITAGVVLAAVASTKVGDVVDEHNEAMQDLDRSNMSEEDKKDQQLDIEAGIVADPDETKADIWRHTVGRIAAMYAPALGTYLLGVFCILSSYKIMKARHAALVAAYTALDTAFREYRERVKNKFGEDVDQAIMSGDISKEVDENGNVIKRPDEPLSPYGRFFDESCIGWERDASYNLSFLLMVQAQMNKMLQQNGYLFLNTVYEALGIPKTKAGHVVGWIYRPWDTEVQRDNYISFGIGDGTDQRSRDFINGWNKSIYLDFNVDGIIYNDEGVWSKGGPKE